MAYTTGGFFGITKEDEMNTDICGFKDELAKAKFPKATEILKRRKFRKKLDENQDAINDWRRNKKKEEWISEALADIEEFDKLED